MQAERAVTDILSDMLKSCSCFRLIHGHNLRDSNDNVIAEIDHLVYCALSEPPDGLVEFVAWLRDPGTTAYLFEVKAVFHMYPGTQKWRNYTEAPTSRIRNSQMQRYATWNAITGIRTFYMMMCPDVGDHRAAPMSPTVVDEISWVEETPNLLNLVAHNNTGVGMLYPKTLREMTFV